MTASVPGKLPYLKLLRPHQWVKNLFVLVGVLFSQVWTQASVIHAALMFASFCAMASAVYIMNDLFDIKADREHPKKRFRPIASGQVPATVAWAICAVLVLFSAGVAGTLSRISLACVLVYLVLNIAYSLRLKHIPVLDVFIIASGFMLRIVSGSEGLGFAMSSWLLLCGMMVTLFLGFAKRRAELLLIGNTGNGNEKLTRRVLEDYSTELLNHCISVCAAGTVITYAMYTMSPDVIAQHGTDKLIYTVPFIIYGIFRYLYLLHGHGKGNDTADDLLQDRHMLVTVLGWGVATITILHLA